MKRMPLGINSFGYGGANAHVILEAAGPYQNEFVNDESDRLRTRQSTIVLPLSTASAASLKARVADLGNWDFGSTELDDLAYTLASRRTQLPMRGFLLASQGDNISRLFSSQAVLTSPVPASRPAPYAFVFTGQGSQRPGMCSELFAEFPVFRQVVVEMDLTILDIDNPDLIHRPERSQPCCTAIQIALVQLLASWGIAPATTVGHSSGEIAAAFAAGHISAAEAIVIAYYRGYLVSNNKAVGAMMTVGLSEREAANEITLNSLDDKLTVACVNSPDGVNISGDHTSVVELHRVLEKNKVFARVLKTGGQGYHSHHMLAMGEEYEALLDRRLPVLGPSTRLPKGATFVSSVDVGAKSSDFKGRYWRQNLESQVHFVPAIEYIQAQSDHCFVELGPHSSLELPIRQILTKANGIEARVNYAAPIKRNENALQSVLRCAGSLWMQGCDINWSKVNGLQAPSKPSKHLHRVVTSLPPYRFNYEQTLWAEGRSSVEYRQRRYGRHELLGSLMDAGNGRDFIFRNIIRLGDIPWLQDHKLGNNIVFPGTGYLAMAMEAMMQVSGVDYTKPSFHFSNVNITNALALPSEYLAQTEMFFSLHRRSLPSTATSSKWWKFNVSSYTDGDSVSHATGAVAMENSASILKPKYQPQDGTLESTARRIWYEKLTQQVLNYGPTFQTITHFETSRMKSESFCTAKGPLLKSTDDDPTTEYPVHPITLDALLQLAAVSAAKAATPSDMTCRMNSVVRSTGFGSLEAGAELIQEDGEVVVQFDQVKLNPYSAGTQSISEIDTRHPVLRLLWKPDSFAREAGSSVSDASLIKFGAIIDLLVHKDSRARILELGNGSRELTTAVLDLLSSETAFKRFSSYNTAAFDDEGVLSGQLVDTQTGQSCTEMTHLQSGAFDLVLIPVAGPWVQRYISQITSLLADGASVLTLCPEPGMNSFQSSGLSCLTCPTGHGLGLFTVARPVPKLNMEALRKHEFLIVEREEESKLGMALAHTLKQIQGHEVARTTLDGLTTDQVSKTSTIFNLCELKRPLLSTISDHDMRHVKVMTDNATALVWVTGGNLLLGGEPDFALASGVARAVGMEQPALKFYTYDIDDPEANVDMTAQRLISVLNQQGSKPDMEFVQRDGLVHVSRFVPDDGVNKVFRNKQGLEHVSLAAAAVGAAQLFIEQPSQFDSIFFHQQETPSNIGPRDICIKVASVEVNAKDYYVLAGRVETQNATCQLECAGTVVQTGSDVTEYAVGDPVVAMAPTHCQTYQVLPTWACHKLQEEDSFDVCATLPVVYSTALYALQYRAKLQAGETVLIHSGAGGVGIAAIEVALAAGAEVFTTVSTDEKREFLVKTFGIGPSNIFSSRDTYFSAGILKATAGRGVDVVLNSLIGDQLHATWRCVADFGRFVEIGKMDLSTAGRLEMDPFLKNTTFTAFDLSYLYNTDNEQHHALWNQLLSEVIRIGKIAINLENGSSEIKVQRLRYETSFHPDKSYVMVGCLGGLGRTLARWMVSRGARKFASLGRSGLQNPAAQNLVSDLNAFGAKSSVVTGDVCNAADVEQVVAAAEAMGSIGGVVQAAMGLNEAIFSDMSNSYWHTGIDPKGQGSWNLLNALKLNGNAAQLDFFLMTSSVSGSVGTATESNYCAGNHFLDLFARHLRNLGLPGISVGLGMISEVGYLHDNPEIEALLLRKGIQPIDADELVQILDLALASAGKTIGVHHAYNGPAIVHQLTGLEASGVRQLRKRGFEGNHPVLEDSRAGLLASALGGDDNNPNRHGQKGDMPAEVTQAMEKGQTLSEAVLSHVRYMFANLVLMQYDAVAIEKPLAEYGMDSMIGAEFRTWLYQSLRADVPLSMLLGKSCTLKELSNVAIAVAMEKSEEE
ncbi:Uu.00g088340.m01.CDS01 [Anthostomella pinea]|uniref:Uu.00g088340.m01.CDS01 n=1 Tax=Anthostomella pinea TaxID=933095 RepID=A0AAI8VML0_9PEZI|nr:Uu.00g088340.m01.CDS01 [Anthostomella pinea]